MNDWKKSSLTELTIIAPCYNEEDVLLETAELLIGVLTQLQECGAISGESTVCFVDDGSRDDTWSLIQRQAELDSRIHGIKLSKNSGHQNALLAGLTTSQADAVVSIDADLQDDIGVISEMVDAFHGGSDIVYGVRRERKTDSWFKRVTAQVYYRILSLMGVNVVFNHADYRLMSRRAIEALKDYGEVNLFLRGIIPTIGYPSSTVEYDRKERLAGQSKYSLRKMLSLAINGVTSFSPVPLRMIAVMGMGIFLISIVLAGWVLWTYLFVDGAVPGWASSVLPIYALGGIQLLSIGVLGEYVAKIYMETKRRPRFTIEKII